MRLKFEMKTDSRLRILRAVAKRKMANFVSFQRVVAAIRRREYRRKPGELTPRSVLARSPMSSYGTLLQGRMYRLDPDNDMRFNSSVEKTPRHALVVMRGSDPVL